MVGQERATFRTGRLSNDIPQPATEGPIPPMARLYKFADVNRLSEANAALLPLPMTR